MSTRVCSADFLNNSAQAKQITQVSLLAVLLSGGFSEQTPLQTLFTKDYAKLIKTSSVQHSLAAITSLAH